MAGLQGRVFGGYRLAEQLAGGGIAEVYRAQPVTSGGREVVVKIIYPEFARHPAFQSNFRNIVQMAAKLVNHPHILPVIASGEEGGYLYLVTPYVAQGTLRDWLQVGHRLGPTDVGPFFRQLCGAIAYAHSLGIVHSNLKLSNIFLFEGRHVLVADFGLLWDITHLDMNHTGSGTDAVEFLAPEGFSGNFTQQSDIYALGALLFATLTGFPPFQGRKPADLYSAHMQHPVPKLAQAAPQTAPQLQGLDSVIQRAMAKRPEERFPSAMALTQAVEAALRQPMPALPAQQGRAPYAAAAPAAPVHYPGAQPSIPPAAPPFLGAPGGPQPGNGAMAPATPGSPLSQLNPPFPPLGGEQHVDANMERAHEWPTLAHAVVPRQQRPALAPPANDSEILRTAVVPKPQLAPSPSRVPMQPSMPPGGMGQEYSAPARGGDLDPMEDFGPLKMPAIRPQGLVGTMNNGSPQVGAATEFSDDSPLGDDRYDGGTNFHRSLAVQDSNQGDWWSDPHPDQGSPQSQSLVPWQGSNYSVGDASMAHSGAFAKPAFSATELELPRLTNPALEGQLPPEWEDLLADEFASQRAANSRRRNGELQTNAYSRDNYNAGSRYNGWSSELGQSGWSNDGSYSGWPGEAGGAALARPSQYEAPPLVPEIAHMPRREHSQDRGDLAYPNGSFAEQPGWTGGSSAARRPRHWASWLLVGLVLFTIVASSILIAKPELCPIAACAQASQFVRSHLPMFSAQPQQDLFFVPTSLDFKTTAGGTSEKTLEMRNSGSAPITWQASTDLLWLTVLPTDGVLNPSTTKALKVTAKPVGINPDTYHSTVIITVGDRATNVPTTIVVAPGPQLSFSPAKLTFTTCDSPQQFTVRNSGGGLLSFTATPSVTSAMTLNHTKGTLEPGKSISISVTMTCSAQTGAYKVMLAGNGGKGDVAVQYG